MSRLLLPASCLVLLALAGCPASSSHAPTSSTTPTPAAADERCPMAIPGTSVAVEDTATGGALVFASTGDLAGLRARVGGWATRHNERHGAMGPLPTGDEPAGGGHDHAHHEPAAHPGHGNAEAHGAHGEPGAAAVGATLAIDPATLVGAHSRAEATDTDAGARLLFITFPDQVAALQSELRAHAEHLTAQGCTGAP